MGKVYTPEELQGRFIPKKGAHAKAAAAVLGLKSAFDYSQLPVTGVMIHGSVARGEANRRSDLDVLTILPELATVDDCVDYIISLGEVEAKHKVVIEPIVLTPEDAKSGNHSIDVLFLNYLKSAEPLATSFKRVDGNTGLLTDLITPYESDPAVALHRYLIAKRDKFTKKTGGSDVLDPGYTQRALELPRALQRRFQQAYGLEILSGDFPFTSELNELTNIDTWYTDLLEETLATKNYGNYKEELRDISDGAQHVARKLSLAAVAFAQTLAK